MIISEKEYSTDSLFDGRLQCMQHRRGYRFSIDSILLAHFFAPKPGERILDLGGGCGIISLLLAFRHPKIKLVTLELQSRLADLIRRNLVLNDASGADYQQRIEVITGDLRCIKKYLNAGSFDWVVCNPPYGKSSSGRINPLQEQALARHELKADLEQIIRAACFALKTKGRAAFVYPAKRGVSLFHVLRSNGLEPKKLQIIYSYPRDDASLLLVEAIKSGGEELKILPPFYVYEEQNGSYSREMAQLYKP